MKSIVEITQDQFGKFIKKDFQVYDSTYSFKDIDQIKINGAYIKVSIQDGNVYVSEDSNVNNKSRKATTHLESVIKHGKNLGLKFPNVSFVYSIETTGLKEEEINAEIKQIPIFTLCNPKGFKYGIRIPNMYFGDVFKYDNRMSTKRKISELIKYNKRKKKIYFRGGASGYGSLPRIKLVALFENHPWFDVNIVSRPKSETLFKDDLDQIKTPLSNHQTNITNSFYQYAIHMPGSAKDEAYSYGLQELLPWGNTVIFIDQTCYEWYYEKLLEDELVLVTNLEHLESDVKSWFENDDLAEKKAQLSRKFSEDYLNKDIITAYWYLVLTEYAKSYSHLGHYYKSKIDLKEEVDLDAYHLKVTYHLLNLRLKPIALGLNQIVMLINKISRKMKGR